MRPSVLALSFPTFAAGPAEPLGSFCPLLVWPGCGPDEVERA